MVGREEKEKEEEEKGEENVVGARRVEKDRLERMWHPRASVVGWGGRATTHKFGGRRSPVRGTLSPITRAHRGRQGRLGTRFLSSWRRVAGWLGGALGACACEWALGIGEPWPTELLTTDVVCILARDGPRERC